MIRYIIEFSNDNGATFSATTIDPFIRELTAKRTAELMQLNAIRNGANVLYRTQQYKLASPNTSYETLIKVQ